MREITASLLQVTHYNVGGTQLIILPDNKPKVKRINARRNY